MTRDCSSLLIARVSEHHGSHTVCRKTSVPQPRPTIEHMMKFQLGGCNMKKWMDSYPAQLFVLQSQNSRAFCEQFDFDRWQGVWCGKVSLCAPPVVEENKSTDHNRSSIFTWSTTKWIAMWHDFFRYDVYLSRLSVWTFSHGDKWKVQLSPNTLHIHRTIKDYYSVIFEGWDALRSCLRSNTADFKSMTWPHKANKTCHIVTETGKAWLRVFFRYGMCLK